MNTIVPKDVTRALILGLLLACAAGLPGLQAFAADPPDEAAAQAPSFHAVDPQLAQLIAILLEENPRALSARAATRSTREREAQVTSLPNPTLTYRYYAETPETRVGPQRQALELSQGVPWFGKREQQGRRAAHQAAAAEWQARELELELVAELKRHYFEAAFVQEALAVNADEILLLRRFERIALTRYSTGEGIQQSVIKVQTDISRLVDGETALRQRLDLATRRIARLIGRVNAPLVLRPISLELVAVDADAALLGQGSILDHPSVKSVEQTIQADVAWARRNELASRPDFRFGVGYVDVGNRDDPAGLLNPPQDNGKDVWSLSVGLDIPLYRKRVRSGVAEARASMDSNERRLEDTRDELSYAIQEAVLRLHSVQERALLYQEVIVPQAGQALASAEAAYTTDRQGVLDLLDAERVLFQARLTYHRLLADHWSALADLERSLGRAFPVEGS